MEAKGVKMKEEELEAVRMSVGERALEASQPLMDDASMTRGEANHNADLEEDNELKFVLCSERYLIGHDIRGLVQLDEHRWGVVAWNESKVYTIDRSKPDAVLQFNMPAEERHCISMRLIPYYDMAQFPFAIVLCQASIYCIDFKRYNSFKICPWKYKGVPNNVN